MDSINQPPYLSDPDRYDSNYHQFNVYSSHQNSRRISPRHTIIESPITVQRRTQSQLKLKKLLGRFGLLLANSSATSVYANCSIASERNSCEVASVRTMMNFDLDSSSACWTMSHTNLTITGQCSHSTESSTTTSQPSVRSIFAITPTYARYTQKVDLTSLCQMAMHVQNLVWIIVEDSSEKTDLVADLLDRCKVTSVHLNVRTPPSYRPRPGADRYKEMYSRGVKQRNLGLGWIRKHCSIVKNCTGAVYFMDDDNKYDLRLFEEIRKTENVSVFPVGFSGGLKVEGPTCNKERRAVSWHAEWGPDRPFPIDMAGFAIQVTVLLSKPDVWVGFDELGEPTQRGYLETSFLEKFTSRDAVECRGNDREVLVWHVKTQKPWILYEVNNPTDDHFEV
ncbi:galactosylgalactosylxylosylprotein 3-beta-glucuronosyltransferase I-like isoform X2 [Halichondria panicea]|uniref:galactosylgalactosylxylosylprotein 3-beta-glucuronosyltransferase I-like isoform X2 n=1 Tax=Halichondria panicea TaxID=6063 RepID=UPI00312B5FF1